MKVISYRDKDGLSDRWKFIGDWLFATELLEYVEKTYGDARWYIDSCSQTGPGTFIAKFRPFYGYQGTLSIRIVYNSDLDDWKFFPS